ncbi:hypothetical protein NHX12_034454 [Muraenolepis orangiensis]|uniref:Kelch n=1 Tax=Muraenolepis orangiensis TaxID=630683 RepID=A0A9Q0D765_9TELE|nr:hypothetical protein NHX12_034454 [Muraenolepis orangiensis]
MDLWHQAAPMHSRRCYVSAAVLDGCIFAMGGYDGHTRLNSVERYEPDSNQWSLVASMHEHRSDASASTLGNMVGGFDGESRLSSAEAYSPATGAWRPVPSMISARGNFGLAVLGELLYVVGGHDGLSTTFNIKRYDDEAERWSSVRDMTVSRSELSCCVVSGLADLTQYAFPRPPLEPHQDGF